MLCLHAPPARLWSVGGACAQQHAVSRGSLRTSTSLYAAMWFMMQCLTTSVGAHARNMPGNNARSQQQGQLQAALLRACTDAVIAVEVDSSVICVAAAGRACVATLCSPCARCTHRGSIFNSTKLAAPQACGGLSQNGMEYGEQAMQGARTLGASMEPTSLTKE